jgi:hypothetical protein
MLEMLYARVRYLEGKGGKRLSTSRAHTTFTTIEPAEKERESRNEGANAPSPLVATFLPCPEAEPFETIGCIVRW